MNRCPHTLRDFLDDFVNEHADAESDELLLDITAEEAQELGLFFVRGVCGWIHTLRRAQHEGGFADVGSDLDEEGSDEETEAIN